MTDIGAKISLDGEKQFKSELAQITQEGKTLSAQMDQLTTSFKNEGQSEKDAAEISKKLSSQIENQEKLVSKLKEAVARSSEKTGENSTETLKWKEKLAKAEKGLSDLKAQADGTGKEVDELTSSEKDASEQTSLFGDVLKGNLASQVIISGVKATAKAVKDVAKFCVEAVTGAAEYADEMNTLSKTTGLSTDTLQEYRYMAKLTDVDIGTITGSISKLTKNMDAARNGNKETAQAFKDIGVEVTDANGILRKGEDVFNDVLDALRQIPNETERDAVAMKLFGKSAKELNPLIKMSESELRSLKNEAHKVGAVFDQSILNTLNDVQNEFDRVGQTWDTLRRKFGAKIGAAILPDLERARMILQGFASDGDINKLVERAEKLAEQIIKKIPQFTEKILKEIKNAKIGKAIAKLLPSLGELIGTTLGQIFKNLPELLKAGGELGWSLIKGVLGVIPNLVTGIAEGLNGPKISEAAQAAISEFENVKLALEEIPTAAERIEDAFTTLAGQKKQAEYWYGVFRDMRLQVNPTAQDLEKMKIAAAKLNEIFPELGLVLDEETGKWNLSNREIEQNIKLLEARARASAYYSAAEGTLTEIAELELAQEKVRSQSHGLEQQYEVLQGIVTELYTTRKEIDTAYGKLGRGEIDYLEYFDIVSEKTGRTIETWEDAAEASRHVTEELELQKGQLNDLADQLKPKQDEIDEYEEKIQELNKDVEWLFAKGDEWESQAYSIASNLPKGMVRGINDGIPQVEQAAGTLMAHALNRMKDVAMIHSPSKYTENVIGKNLALGVIKGWEDVFESSKMRNAFSLIGVIDPVGTTTNNTTNLGGVSIVVNSAPGQDTSAIAEAVMKKMQASVDARRAVFA